jgi:CelD/BcsL family acetyltransferase involved in cellulose biosynthesis
MEVKPETYVSVGACADEWEALADATHAPPWMRPGWIDAWWQAFGSGRMEIVAARGNGSLAGLVPLVHRHGGIHGPANWHTPAFDVVAVDDSVARSLAETIMAGRPRRVELRFVEPGGPGYRTFTDVARGLGYRTIIRPLEQSPYLDCSGRWEDYEASLDGKFRRELRRRRRRLEREGRVDVDVSGGDERLDDLLAEGYAVEAAGWKGDEGSAIASEPAVRDFYTRVAHWARSRGSLRLGFLRLDGRAIAFDFAIEEAGSHYLLKTGFDPALGRFAPGMQLRYSMLSHVFSGPCSRYEFLGDAAPWKLEWTRSVRPRLIVQAFAPTAAGATDFVAHAAGRPLARRLLALRDR